MRTEMPYNTGDLSERALQEIYSKSQSYILVIGLDSDWESEGFDREHME